MIWRSTAAMIVIDLVVIVAVVGLGAFFLRRRGAAASLTADRGVLLILAGLAMLGLFHLADLVSMLVLPYWIGPASAQSFMSYLHLSLSWIATILTLALVGWGLVLDVRDRRRMEALQAESEARYRSIVQDQVDFIVRWQPGGVRTWVNDPYCEFFGEPREALVGTSFYPLVSVTDRARIERELAELSPAKPFRSGLHRVNLPDGSIGWQEWTDRALFDADGRILEIQSVGRDITERIKTEGALKESEARFRGFVENTSDWVWELDGTGRSVYSNDQVEAILGYAPTELTGVHCLDLVHPDSLDETRQGLADAIADRHGWTQWVWKALHRDGSIRYLESTADPIFGQDGSVVGFRGIDRDATFSTLMLQVSDDLYGCPPAELDARIERALGAIALAYGVQRASFWWQQGGMTRRLFQWAEQGKEATLQSVALERAPRLSEIVLAGAAIGIESLDDPRLSDRDRQVLVENRVKSTLVVPVQGDGEPVAVAVFSTVDWERAWPEKVETELRLLSEKIVAVYTQAEATRKTLRRERDLEQSETLAHVGSFSCYAEGESSRFPDDWRVEFSSELETLLEARGEEPSLELFLSRVHAEDRSKIMAAFERLFANEDEVALEYRLVNPSGQLRHIANRSRIDRDREGRSLRIIGANRDMTEQVLREASLKDALAEIETLRDKLEKENIQLREEVRSIKEFEQIIGDSDALRRPLDLVYKAAPTNASILILGETGTGKELVAKAIHELSLRRDKPMVSLNCTALPAELVESELFGHEKGAFTGAHRRRAGRFEMADGGTIFLDEIGDLPLPLQGKLLRVLQEGAFEPLGSTRTIKVDVRLIAATNRNLQEAVSRGQFRADLYYRINTVPIELPPLRERKQDIPLLVQHFVRKHGARLGKSIDSVSAEVLRDLRARDWPGNVRELENTVERLLIAADGPTLTLNEWSRAASSGAAGRSRQPEATDLKSVERDYILRVLDETGWVIGGAVGAAARLGLPPSTLRSKMRKLAIRRAG